MRAVLQDGFYTAPSVIASAQRCVNLYPERNPADSPFPFTLYPTPGLSVFGTPPVAGAARCLFTSSKGNLYAVVGSGVYAVSPGGAFTLLGSLTTGANPCSMSDNGLVIVLVDGSPNGYAIDINTNAFSTISDPAFFGADRVDFVDTFFLFNRPGTGQFYVSPSNWVPGVAFNPLFIAAKTGASDPLSSLIVMHRELWLVGTKTSEIFFDSGAADFPFQVMPGAFIEHGCVAKYSLAKQDLSTFWLSQDAQGQNIVVMGQGYAVKRISTHAIENEFRSYSAVSDAVGYTYQQNGHTFYVLSFPSADRTWAYDMAAGLWHERAWLDSNGVEHRHRGGVFANAYGKSLVGDWQTGQIYAMDLGVFTDAGSPIERRIGFPHNMVDARRVFYRQLIADMEVGTDDGSIDGSTSTRPPLVSLRWSDTRGVTWGNPITSSLGAAGQYLTNIQFQRLGMARDRVFELFWSAPVKTALSGAYVDAKASAT